MLSTRFFYLGVDVNKQTKTFNVVQLNVLECKDSDNTLCYHIQNCLNYLKGTTQCESTTQHGRFTHVLR